MEKVELIVMNLEFSKWLDQSLEENHLSYNDETKNKLLKYLMLIHDWNRVFNLTAITHPRDMVYLHIIDSLLIAPYLHGSHLLDVGSGAGLPGIPLAIADPSQSWVLLDKNNKKTKFLTQVVAELHLTTVNIIHDRVENFYPEKLFDSILSRAFGTLSLFVEATEHLLAPNGFYLAMKGKYPKEELNDVPKRFIVTDVHRLDLQGTNTNIERHLILLKSV